MYQNFEEILEAIQKKAEKKRVAVAAAGDHEVLECAVMARDRGIADFTLIGDQQKIEEILAELGQNAGDWTILDEPDDKKAAAQAVALCAEGEANALMKGLLHTSVFLRALFNKQYGLVPEKALVSQITVTEYPLDGRLVLITDNAISVAPTYSDKVKIIQNAATLAHRLGNENPKVACLAAVEVVNENMPETIEAAMLAKAADRGQIKGCTVDGPFALDNALSLEAAATKGITGEVAGNADILLVPNLVVGNVLDKSLRYFAGLKTGSAVVGANVPIIMTSRSDSAENKLHAVALSVL